MHTTDHSPGHGAGHDGGHELSDAKVKPLIESGILLVVISVVSFWSMDWFMTVLQDLEAKQTPAGNELTAEREIPAGVPLLEVKYPTSFMGNPAVFFSMNNLPAYYAPQQVKLHSYGWVDETQKLVHIPIEKAMQKAVESLPVRK
jgi:hypothetical protein